MTKPLGKSGRAIAIQSLWFHFDLINSELIEPELETILSYLDELIPFGVKESEL